MSMSKKRDGWTAGRLKKRTEDRELKTEKEGGWTIGRVDGNYKMNGMASLKVGLKKNGKVRYASINRGDS